MLSSAVGAAGPDLGDMNLLDLIEFTRPCRARTQLRPGMNPAPTTTGTRRAGFVIEFEQTTDLRRLIGRRDHSDALVHRPTSQTELRPGRRSNDDDGGVVRDPPTVARNHTVAEIVDEALTSFEVGVADLEGVDSAARSQLPGDPSTGCTGAEEQDPRHERKSSTRSSLHPPEWGGMPHGHEP